MALIGDNSNKRDNDKPIERAEYRGHFRLIGAVYTDSTFKSSVGYAVLDVKSKQLKLFTVEQTKALLKEYEFENVKLVGDEIENTECSMDRLLKFNTKKKVIGENKITILGEIFKNGEHFGYRVVNGFGEVVDLTESQLVYICEKSNSPLVNAKFVKKESAAFISAIKGSFKRIEITDNTAKVNNVKAKKGVKAKDHRNYLNKCIDRYTRRAFGAKGTIKVKDEERLQREFVKVKYPELDIFGYTPSGLNPEVYKVMSISTQLALVKNLRDTIEDERKLDSIILRNRVRKGYTSSIINSIFFVDDARYRVVRAKSNTRGNDMSAREDVYNRLGASSLMIYKADTLKATIEKLDDLTVNDLTWLDVKNYLLVYLEQCMVMGSRLNYTTETVKSVYNKNKFTFINEVFGSRVLKLRLNKLPRHIRTKADIANIDLKTEEGLAHMGCTLSTEHIGKEFYSSFYQKTISLRYAFDIREHIGRAKKYYNSPNGVIAFSEEVLTNLINCYGDISLFYKCIHLASWVKRGNDAKITMPLLETILVVQSAFNYPLVEYCYDLLVNNDIKLTIGKELLKSTSTRGIKFGVEDLTYYESGFKFTRESLETPRYKSRYVEVKTPVGIISVLESCLPSDHFFISETKVRYELKNVKLLENYHWYLWYGILKDKYNSRVG